MSTIRIVAGQDALVKREMKLQRMLIAYILTGLIFLMLPGTFLGVWNLISIGNRHALDSLSPAFLQAHGHAQIFGWIGTFILGIGFYSLTKMGNMQAFAIPRGWYCYGLWTAGITLRWVAGILGWQWRVLLPLSALLELAAFLMFFRTVSRHRAAAPASADASVPRKREPWMWLVMASTLGFLVTLVVNFAATTQVSISNTGPALAHVSDQRLVTLATWGFLVPAVWGFNARWLPVFLGLEQPRPRFLFLALALTWTAILTEFAGSLTWFAALLPFAALAVVFALHIAEPSSRPAKTTGVHPSFPLFVRLAYVWLLVAAALSVRASWSDVNGGIWGASRHALTVGFLSTMVFAIGQRILPAFCGARVLYSPRLMLASLAALNIGCVLRVAAEIPAYEANVQIGWHLLPWSAVIELLAVSLFAANMALTLLQPPAHLRPAVMIG
ncbi:MAG TPA: NnrS family protein [Bryobacteraceae bacterium]|nr:NnrS family protein [Bryobacteraceae bacterium]